MSLRLRRLQADYEAVRRMAVTHPRIEVEGVSGSPPDRYRFLLRVESLRELGGAITRAREHRLEVTLPHGYPRDPPVCRMLTPVFHPNIAPHGVCIGDHWSAGESLEAMVQRVVEMLAYQSYNIKSPLNGSAAQWAEQHLEELPIDRSQLFVDLAAAPEPQAAAGCANCGAAGALGAPCAAGHQLCSDCSLGCGECGRALCLSCGVTRCPEEHASR
jgi:ubiquitin-protein ligase